MNGIALMTQEATQRLNAQPRAAPEPTRNTPKLTRAARRLQRVVGRPLQEFSGLRSSPASCAFVQRRFVDWPVMERRWIEVGTIRPHQRMNLGIHLYTVENRFFSQRTIHFTHKYRFEIDRLRNTVVEMDTELVTANNFKLSDTVDFVIHDLILGARLASVSSLAAIVPNQQPTQPDAIPPRLPLVFAVVLLESLQSTQRD